MWDLVWDVWTNMDILLLILSFVFGSCIGSFLNVVILRLPREEKLSGRSHCMHCGHQLSSLDLIPLAGYLMLLGKCRYCGRKISSRYFIIEAIVGSLFALTWWLLMPQDIFGYFRAALDFFIIAVLVAVFVIDLEHYLILDEIILPAGLLVAAANLVADLALRQPILSWHSHFISGLLAAIAAAGLFFCLWFFSKGRWMGFGDVKLMVFLGLCLGWPKIFVCVFVAVILGGLVSVLLLAFSSKTLKSRLPFGTFLAASAVMALFFGEKLFHWYLGLLGF